MAINGQLVADFGSFYEACRRGSLELVGFEASSKRLEAALGQMVDSFSGRQIISEATLMAEAVTRIGSPARLTAAELQRIGAAAAEAAEKLRRAGEEVPPKFDLLAAAAARARGETGNLATSMRQFDGVLSSVGVNIGVQTRAIEDLANAAGKSATEIGVVGTAGLAASVGIGSYGLTRSVIDATVGTQKWDSAIGDVTAKLFGYGDVAGQEAAAGTDALARASRVAGYAVTSMAEAMKINEAEARRLIAANIKNSEAARQLAIDDAKATAIMGANRQRMIKEEHDLAVAIQGRRAEDAAAYADMQKKSAADVAQAQRDIAAARAAEVAGAAELGRALQEADLASQAAQRKIREDALRSAAAIKAEQEAADLLARSLGNTIDYDLSTPGGLEQFKRLNPGATFTGAAAQKGYFDTHTLAEAVRDGLVSYGRYAAAGGAGPQSTPGGSAPLVPRTFLLEELTNAIPAGGRGRAEGGRPIIYAPVSVSGVFDPASKKQLGDAVSSSIARAVSIGRR